MNLKALRILKLGGSLLNRSDWPSSLTQWLKEQSLMRNILLVGGGLLTDAVRRFDQAHELNPLVSHRAAVESMGLSLQLAKAILPRSRIITSVDLSDEISPRRNLDLLDVRPFMSLEETSRSRDRLPHDWSATSDSIAARLADFYNADALVLLKSKLPVACDDWESAAYSGVVDRHFPKAVQRVPDACCIDLTDPGFAAWRPL